MEREGGGGLHPPSLFTLAKLGLMSYPQQRMHNTHLHLQPLSDKESHHLLVCTSNDGCISGNLNAKDAVFLGRYA